MKKINEKNHLVFAVDFINLIEKLFIDLYVLVHFLDLRRNHNHSDPQ